MKAIPFFSLFVLITPLTSQAETPAAGNKAEIEKLDLLPNQKAFLNLPQETRKDFMKHLTEASRLFQQKRIFETLEELDKTSKIFMDSPEVYNLRGSCYVEMRAFDKSLDAFKKALELSKENPSIEFNIGEVYFVSKQWQKSLDLFENLIKRIPKESTAFGRLIEFKMLLCKKKLGKDEEAKKLAEKYDFLDDSPFYYYVQAMMAYDENNPIKAEEWLARASRIFQDVNSIAPWQDTLVEYGYIDNSDDVENKGLAPIPKKKTK